MRKLSYEQIQKRRYALNKRDWPSEVYFEKKLKYYGIKGYRRNWCLEEIFFGDFVWIHLKLVIEIDGSSHNGKKEYDERRDAFLKSHGWKVMRVSYKNRADKNRVAFAEVIKLLLSYDREILNYSGLEKKLYSRSKLTPTMKFMLRRSKKKRFVENPYEARLVVDAGRLHDEIKAQKEINKKKTQVVWIRGQRRVVVLA